ncbi:hypothetical protein N7478_006884 [Penicillium angulare]|uniref:uncharacterized protein n=1 Tax=Penicillium angulare TaxID=116970 RepID=UPI00253F721B|nr:uncharacterized protein N7478_006884 [Penicillium angulare]KAJ5281512.1 hypothetical protein N7478_006884 [Penicillium angulare]
MDSKDAQAERLKRMQMTKCSQKADLGIHRRDYISARDDRKNIPHVRMEDLEAARQSNIPGTTAHGEAQRNKRILSEWTSTYRRRAFKVDTLTDLISRLA